MSNYSFGPAITLLQVGILFFPIKIFTQGTITSRTLQVIPPDIPQKLKGEQGNFHYWSEPSTTLKALFP